MWGHCVVGVRDETLAYAGRNIDLAWTIGHDICVKKFLPQRGNILAILTPGYDLSSGRATSHLIVVLAIS